MVASPGDVQAERDVLRTVLEELNQGIAGEHGLRLELARWETDAYPGLHPEGPPGLIDAILRIEDCDILIGIFWKRFGTPVQDANSGTEHEFRRAYEAWQHTRRPHIMVYFNQRPYKPRTKAEADQWGQVLDFRENFPQEGLWWPYKGKSQFEKLVRQHLTRFIREQMSRPADTPRARHEPANLTPAAITALRKSYLTWLMEQVRAVPLAGIDPKSIREETRRDLDLAAVYTALMTQRSESTVERGLRLDREREQLSALAMANAEPRLALLGDPGSGKSTFVNFVALCMAGELLGHPDANLSVLRAAVPEDDEAPRNRREVQLQPWDHGPLMPIRVMLREFVARSLLPVDKAVEVTGDTLWNDIVEALPLTLRDFAQPLRDELESTGGLLLLDGLDEVPEADQRRVQVKTAVEQFATLFPNVRILVTSRTYAYQRQDWKLNRFAEAGLAPFSAAQIRAFVDQWYAHVGPARGLSVNDIQGQALLLNEAIRRSPLWDSCLVTVGPRRRF